MIHPLLAVDVKKNLGFETHLSYPEQTFDTIEFDSRDISNPSQTLFICLKGQKSDGHDYIQDLISKGVKSFLVSDAKHIKGDANFYLCQDTLKGFQALATYIRNGFDKDVIAITGSNGKTIVKEWLGQLLSVQWNVCKSPKSFNSQIGVPYSVSKIAHQDIAIFETGISTQGEMTALENIIQPKIGIFTNIGDAHSEGFDSLNQKIEEKFILFKNCKKIIYSSDQELIDEKMKASFTPQQLISWGKKGIYKVEYTSKENATQIKVKELVFETNLIDKASLENATHAIVSALELGLSVTSIQYGLSLLKSVDMRFELKEGARNNIILNDSYNNDLAGLKMTLDLAKKINLNQEMILLVSDFVHQDLEQKELKKELKQILDSSDLSQIFWVGNSAQVDNKTTCFASTKELANYIQSQSFSDTFFIVKGARQFEFEQLTDVLELKQHITRVEVNLSRLIQNYNYYKSLLKPQTKIMVMVKAFAYGTGIVEVAKLLEINQVNYLAVAYADEGVLLRNNGITKPIMVMNVTLEDYEHLVQHNLEPEIYSLEQLTYFSQKTNVLRYHIKLDTGMHRLGFDASNIDALVQYLGENKNIQVQSILTHLAATDEAIHDEYTKSQLSKFEAFCTKIEAQLSNKPLRHALNSAGIERFTDQQYDMVRLGIGIYGFGVKKDTPLKQVITLKTHISQIRSLDASETIGYGRKGKISRDSRIATIPIGYADGYDRRFSNGLGSVLINGHEAKVIGNVCMDMTMIDVTDIDCKAGDEVIVYNDVLTADKQATKIGTISYELLTHLSERVRRIFFFE